MKSSFYVLFLGILIASLVLPVIASAQIECCKLAKAITLDGIDYIKDAIVGAPGTTLATCPHGVPAGQNATDKWGVICFLNMMNIVINWIFIALMILVIILVLFGAFDIMTAGGNVEKVTLGRTRIMYAAIGLIVALVARAIPSIVRSIFG